jgi:hypothetical protein
MKCPFSRHDWRDVYQQDDLLLQECRRCRHRRSYIIGIGPTNHPWSDADMEVLSQRDKRAVIRIVLTNDGVPSGLMVVVNLGKLPPESIKMIQDGLEEWKKSGEKSILFAESSDASYEFITIEQLTRQQ